MQLSMLGLIAGMLSLRLLPTLPNFFCLLMLLFAAVLLLLCRRFPLAAYCIGLCWACLSAQSALDDQLVDDLDGRTLWIEGRVVGLPEWPQVSGQPVTVRFELKNASSRRAVLPKRIRLTWRSPEQSVRAGERWRLAVRLKQPDAVLNPHGFDYQAWLLSKRIGATGSVKAGHRLATGEGIDHWREKLRSQLQAVAPISQQAVMTALLLGDSSGLSDQQWQLLQNTGTVHLMVISGQHISLIAAMAYAVVALLQRLGCWPARWLWLPVACGLSILAALLYGTWAGFAVPVQRACIMVITALLWRCWFQHLSGWTAFLVALSLVLLYEPLVVLQAGFWLSFAAVGALILAFSGRLGAWRWWQVLTRTQWVAAMGLLPFLLALSLPVSALGPLANLFAVPWLSLFVLPFTLLAAALLPWPALSAALFSLAGWFLDVMFMALQWLAQSQTVYSGAAVGGWALVLALLVVLGLLLPRPIIPLLAIISFGLPLLRTEPLRVEPGQAQVWLLDVGQGLAVSIKTAKHSLLYDAGPMSAGFDAGERIVVPFLQGQGLTQLDVLLVSHADADHAGGAVAVLKAMQVQEVVSGQPLAQLAKDATVEPCTEKQWQWDGVWFWRWQWEQANDSNQRSCVLLIDAQGERLLLTGDLDAAGEAALIAAWPWLKADWLVVGHHGSRTSSSRTFLQVISAQYALISRAKHNNYGHPHPQVLANLQQAQVQVYDTALDKAVQIRLGSYQEPWTMVMQSRFWRQK